MPGFIDRLTDRVRKDWHVIVQAKLVFGAAALLVFLLTAGGAWLVARDFYSERIAVSDKMIEITD
jgi:hypothetical protein